MVYSNSAVQESFAGSVVPFAQHIVRVGGVEALAKRGDSDITYRVRDPRSGRVYQGVVTGHGETSNARLLSSNCTCETFDCAHGCAAAIAAIGPGARWVSEPIAVPSAEDRALSAWMDNRERAIFAEPANHSYALLLRPGTAFPITVTTGPDAIPDRMLELRALSHEQSLLFLLASSGLMHVAPYRTYGETERRRWNPKLAAVALEQIVLTGRAHIDSPNSPSLSRWAPITDTLAWTRNAADRLILRPAHHPGVVLLPTDPVWGIDPASNECGPIDVGLPANAVARAITLPPVSDEQAKRLHRQWHRHFALGELPPPPTTLQIRYETVTPQPLLRISGNPLGAMLTFRYPNHVVAPDDPVNEFEQSFGSTIVITPRNRGAEQDAVALLRRYDVDRDAEPERWLRFLRTGAPELRSAGWIVDVDETVPFHIDEAADWHFDLRETDNHWFDLELGVDVDGKRYSVMPELLATIRNAKIRTAEQLDEYLSQMDGLVLKTSPTAYVVLPKARVMQMFATLVELFDDPPSSKAGNLQLSRAQLTTLELGDGIELRVPDRELLAPLVTFLRDPVAPDDLEIPALFTGTLRPYQLVAVQWLQLLRRCGFGGVLADEMGLGKSVMIAAHLAIEKTAGRLDAPALIVAKTNGYAHWLTILERFVPEMRVHDFTGVDRHDRLDEIGTHDIVLTTHACFTRSHAALSERQWSVAVVDEAQAMKSLNSQLNAASQSIQVAQPIALTGTPVENTLDDLHSIMSFAVPGLLGDRRRFVRLFRTPIEKYEKIDRQIALSRRIAPFLLRRTKEEVAPELPPKTEMVTEVVLSGAQRDLYETVRVAMLERVRRELREKGLARSHIVVLDALLKLRQVCCDPRLVKLQAARNVTESQKLEDLLEMLQEQLADGRRILLFSQWTEMLDLIIPELEQRNIGFAQIRGSTRPKQRKAEKDRFDAGEVPLFLLSTKAGGTSLDLLTADTVIHYDPWWNPAVEAQATDRAHRLGQTKNVFVYKLITVGTVEERVVAMQRRKGNIAKQLFDAKSLAQLNESEIEGLFAPLK